MLDERRLGSADFAGNRHYTPLGNLSGSNKISIFLIDHPNQNHAKLWGTTEYETEAAPLRERAASLEARPRLAGTKL
jgi:hypothetical protein